MGHGGEKKRIRRGRIRCRAWEARYSIHDTSWKATASYPEESEESEAFGKGPSGRTPAAEFAASARRPCYRSSQVLLPGQRVAAGIRLFLWVWHANLEFAKRGDRWGYRDGLEMTERLGGLLKREKGLEGVCAPTPLEVALAIPFPLIHCQPNQPWGMAALLSAAVQREYLCAYHDGAFIPDDDAGPARRITDGPSTLRRKVRNTGNYLPPCRDCLSGRISSVSSRACHLECV